MALSKSKREQNILDFQNEVFDLLVIGGGISGAGVARDAASRGMKVALIEAGDFAEGTSSRSSKLVHGGIRYLENLEFGLVFEALTERRRLFELAPHLVHPLRFMLPVYSGSRVGMFKLGLGMWLYDALALFEMPELHERCTREETLQRMGMLQSDQLVGSFAYSDAYMDDDRLVLETLRSAESFGAKVVNYASATGAQMEDGRVVAAVVKDEITQKKGEIRARHFVSTVGPWTDDLGQKFFGDWAPIMRPTKGVHLTFSRERLPIRDAVVMMSDDEKRIVFAIPRHEMVIVGTTDTDYKGDPRQVHTERADVDYLLAVAKSYFPGAQLEEKDILASYAGVRPLVQDGSGSESKTSREHTILNDPRNITFLSGGKYTTYRHMAEETVAAVLNNFSVEDQVRWGRGRSLEALNPKASSQTWPKARQKSQEWAEEFGVDVDTAHFLTERHGMEAFDILRKYAKQVVPGPGSRWQFEALHSIHETMCLNLRDFYLRRVPLFLSERDHGFSFMPEIRAIFAAELGWSDAQAQEAEIAARYHVKHEMGWLGQPPKA